MNFGKRAHSYSNSVGLIILLAVIVLGCNISTPKGESTPISPTTNPIFATASPTMEATPTMTPTATISSSVAPTLSAEPTLTPTLATVVTPTVQPTPTVVPSITLYDEALHPDWEVVQSSMRYDLQSQLAAYKGVYSLSAQPTTDLRQLFFTVKETAQRPYLRRNIIGITFWLYSGDDYLSKNDLTMTILGSNQYPYWRPDDQSVTNLYTPIFSETRLEFLGVTNSIPPNTWIYITNWIDDRVFDPKYEYVVGFYLKNETGFLRTVLIDDVNIVLLESQ